MPTQLKQKVIHRNQLEKLLKLVGALNPIHFLWSWQYKKEPHGTDCWGFLVKIQFTNSSRLRQKWFADVDNGNEVCPNRSQLSARSMSYQNPSKRGLARDHPSSKGQLGIHSPNEHWIRMRLGKRGQNLSPILSTCNGHPLERRISLDNVWMAKKSLRIPSHCFETCPFVRSECYSLGLRRTGW